MQSYVIFFVVVLAAVSTAQDIVMQKTCIKTTNSCANNLEKTKGIFRNLRSIDGSNPTEDIPKYLKELHEYFEANFQDDCKLETCICTDGKLDCHDTKEGVKALIQKVEAPPCITESPIAARLMQRLHKSIADGDRKQTLSILGLLEKVTLSTLAKPNNEKAVNCISEMVQRIRAPIKAKLQTVEFVECDFCQA